MDLSTWNRHGLIVKPAMEFAYLMAQIQIVQGQILDPKEQQTIRLFVSVFSNVVFRADDDYQIIPQLAPGEQARKACDFAIEYTTDEYAQKILCFVEAKRNNNQSGSQIMALENQAFGYCQEYLEVYPDVDFIYACTLVGTYIRCWKIERNRTKKGDRFQMTKFWGGNSRGDFTQYLDVGLDENLPRLNLAFNDMKTMPPHNMPIDLDYNSIGGRA